MSGRLRAQDLVRDDYTAIGEDATLRDALSLYSGRPDPQESMRTIVVTGPHGEFRGLLPSRELLEALVGEGSSLERARVRFEVRVSEVMRRDVVTAAPDDRLLDLAAKTAGAGLESVPVVEDGRLVGVVRIGDVFPAIAALALAPRPGAPGSGQG